MLSLPFSQQIDQMKFMYLHKILQRENDHWTKKMLYHLRDLNLGWSKDIIDKLQKYDLEQDWEKIKSLSKTNWKTTVKTAVQNKNKQKLLDNCMEQTPHGNKIKTKTAYVYDKLKQSTKNLWTISWDIIIEQNWHKNHCSF